jgi:itaconate CoA-transferase
MGALEGLLVVAIEQAVAAPLCTARLAEAGARVIKIERDSGDFARGYDTAAHGDASYFVWINQGKESIVLDLKDAEDKALVQTMIGRADILVQNLAPGATKRLGLGSDELRQLNPRLVTCDITGYGSSPELAAYKAYDFLIQGEVGLVGISGGENELGRIGVSICDIGAGMSAHAAILQALYTREKTGKGKGIEVSLFDVAADWMSVPYIHSQYGAGAPKRHGLNHPSIAPYGGYTTSDGAITLISIQNEREWIALCTQVFKDDELADNPKFASNNLRVSNRENLDAAINAHCVNMTAQEFRMSLANAFIAFGAVNSVEEFAAHAALRQRQVRTSKGEKLLIPASPVVWSDNEKTTDVRAPALGQNTREICNEFS